MSKLIDGSAFIINLAGSDIMTQWNAKTKKLIYDSRVLTTRKIVRAITLLNSPPGVLFNASAVGIYDEKHYHTEESHYFSHDFLSNVVRDWEVSAFDAEEQDVKVFCLRFGTVLSTRGGALKQLIPFFKRSLGAYIGSGKQYFPFIHIHDVAEAIHFLYSKGRAGGVYNFTAPEIITNAYFSKMLGKKKKKPVFLKIPNFALRLKYGDASNILSQGQQVYPKRLLEQGYKFWFPDIETTLDNLLNS